MKIFLFLLVFIQVHAQDFRADQVKGIRVVGWKGQLVVLGEKSEVVRHRFLAKGSSGAFTTSAQLVDGWLELKVVGPANKQDWRSDIPRIDLEIKSPGLPIIASWVEGDVVIRGWSSSIHLTHKQGKVKIDDCRDAKLSLHDGELEINKMLGSLELDSYAARLTIHKLEGRAKIENFQGRLLMDNSKADVSLKTVQGKNSIEDLVGALDFDNKKGEVAFSQAEGSVSGNSLGGSVDGKIRGAVEVRIRGDEARLNLQLQKGTGARVDLGTSKGSLTSSLALKSDRLENIKLLRGQVNGSNMAAIFVRLQNGDIRLR